MAKKTLTLVIYETNNQEWFWHFWHKNGRIVADSAETYKTKAKCKRTALRIIESLKKGDYEIEEVERN
jgi:uncharacterized protein YegP (UPF0339 family)